MKFDTKLQTISTSLRNVTLAAGIALAMSITPVLADEECSVCEALAACTDSEASGVVNVILDADMTLSGHANIYADRCDIQIMDGAIVTFENVKLLGGDLETPTRELRLRGANGTTLNLVNSKIKHFAQVTLLNIGGIPDVNITDSVIRATKTVMKNLDAIIVGSHFRGRVVTTGDTLGHRVDLRNDTAIKTYHSIPDAS